MRLPRRLAAFVVGASMLACPATPPTFPQGGTDATAGDGSSGATMSSGANDTSSGGDDTAGTSDAATTEGSSSGGVIPSCGDGIVQPPEACDDGMKNAANAACLPSCVAASCGDANIHEGVEACDGTDLAGQSCMTQGHAGGTLVCNADCTAFDTSACFDCGDGTIDPGEECDGAALDGATCEALGWFTGMLACSETCQLDDTDCCSEAGGMCGTDMQCCGGAPIAFCMNGTCCLNQGATCANNAACCSNTCDAANLCV